MFMPSPLYHDLRPRPETEYPFHCCILQRGGLAPQKSMDPFWLGGCAAIGSLQRSLTMSWMLSWDAVDLEVIRMCHPLETQLRLFVY